jgi:hypothetical protein
MDDKACYDQVNQSVREVSHERQVCFFLVLLCLYFLSRVAGEMTPPENRIHDHTQTAENSYQKLSGTVKDLAKGDWLILRYSYDGNQKDYSANPASLAFKDDTFQIEMPSLRS